MRKLFGNHNRRIAATIAISALTTIGIQLRDDVLFAPSEELLVGVSGLPVFGAHCPGASVGKALQEDVRLLLCLRCSCTLNPEPSNLRCTGLRLSFFAEFFFFTCGDWFGV